eukprot:scaffold64077_cov69-Phaeocystis_antarctica.AAC.1
MQNAIELKDAACCCHDEGLAYKHRARCDAAKHEAASAEPALPSTIPHSAWPTSSRISASCYGRLKATKAS